MKNLFTIIAASLLQPTARHGINGGRAYGD